MDLEFSKEDLAFRDEVRAFIAEAFDDDMRAHSAQSKNAHIDKAGQVRWLKRLNDRGWIAPDWPKEYGGTGWSHAQKYIFDMEMALAGAPSTSNMGLKMCAPVVMAFGTPEQKAQHLPKILSTDVWWCQGYSEPGSGSDLASLSMKAERDGDHYVLNGSKIWTTYAQWADWMFCLVRTSNEDIRQKGISFLLLEMNTPGITIVPLPTLDGPPEGDQEINQVFFENVRVPVANRIGEEGQGWTYAKYLLQFERGNPYAAGLTNQLNKVRKIASLEPSDGGGRMIDDPDFRKKLSEMQIKVDVLNATELRMFSARSSGEAMGAASSMLKLEGSQAQQAVTELALEAAGIYAQPFVRDTWAEIRGERNEPRAGPDYAATLAPTYFNYRKTSIYAGSNEIQHNIMAKMVLGL
ncbi:pimeloyl-CoA dehydrogenase large subunit [Phenylobacterium sp. Root77]|jgi:alkylation response protein AidB-like acyl-CoA dehydrogenase|uniref:acyl-CoA dehydrogenase family protein n=1 Tax=unclassified Phenylobacterium TaxID=2640670 RepID=UPI0006FD2252|nr:MULTISPECIES: acyl-CoA dehydrogenase family protein [unclassified Phenylobacterium]KQW72819.1 pimeloyl-CoA dehydrogenase large subunit [Phenylobacterium sp. Root1277]KQW92036.1 pimeloyl-CoA dehydrogenase large subunit [Phenylobacterium sp. Root1290]KRC40268.1 pimeloyl-CoA dehydrogenase large subunit [Phenylobacterium sp. Root77]